MNAIDPLDLVKNDADTNGRDWIRETAFISYGVVTDVVADGIVTVTGIVRNGTAVKTLTVPLVSLSSRLMEDSAAPMENDLVLLLFLDKIDTRMFDNAKARFDATGDLSIFNRFTTGYNKFSAVGILMQPFKGASATVHRHTMGPNGVANYTFKTNATYQGVFRREFNLMFDALPGDSGFVDRLCKVTFGQNSPFVEDHWSAVTRLHGFVILEDDTLQVVTAPVVERYSIYAPITKDIQGTQNITIGKGTNPVADTPAQVTITIGSDADVTVTTESKITVISGDITYEIAVDGTLSIVSSAVAAGPLLTLDAAGNLKVHGDVVANANIPAAKVTLLAHQHPTAPMGPPSPPVPGL